MEFKKTMTEILNLIPLIKNKVIKSPGVYMSETDTTFTGSKNRSDTFNNSTDPFLSGEEQIYVEGKVVINKKS